MFQIPNPNIEVRNKFEHQMTEIPNGTHHRENFPVLTAVAAKRRGDRPVAMYGRYDRATPYGQCGDHSFDHSDFGF
jgi:hypothetical protein